jgi:hypothetical protein
MRSFARDFNARFAEVLEKLGMLDDLLETERSHAEADRGHECEHCDLPVLQCGHLSILSRRRESW